MSAHDGAWAALVQRYAVDADALEEFGAALVDVQRETGRIIARRIRRENPDRSSDWSDGVEWAADVADPDVNE